jgi:hypothetical protein
MVKSVPTRLSIDVCTQALHALDAATWLLQLVEDNPQDTALLRAALAGLRNLSSNLGKLANGHLGLIAGLMQALLVPHRRAVINAKAVPRCIEILRNQLGQPELAFWCCAVLANCCREAGRPSCGVWGIAVTILFYRRCGRSC